MSVLAFLERFKNRIGELQHVWLLHFCHALGLTRHLLPVPLLNPPRPADAGEAGGEGEGDAPARKLAKLRVDVVAAEHAPADWVGSPRPNLGQCPNLGQTPFHGASGRPACPAASRCIRKSRPVDMWQYSTGRPTSGSSVVTAQQRTQRRTQGVARVGHVWHCNRPTGSRGAFCCSTRTSDT